ncbi:hypothetical protein GGS23DRAFT_546762 [Durotheca rogersii]|uniref:uncharacterized protein n=1 Tax=Durotheca rogersii TaxID=419775 RepID=UPI00221E42E4|nr:uncharacterized protein GGS23DRAFT_546762 [Durotheca rogersii]KAI5868682.1 hypothetical protein GGS23DRAFT_546762 [Durotheca rogersii]
MYSLSFVQLSPTAIHTYIHPSLVRPRCAHANQLGTSSSPPAGFGRTNTIPRVPAARSKPCGGWLLAGPHLRCPSPLHPIPVVLCLSLLLSIPPGATAAIGSKGRYREEGPCRTPFVNWDGDGPCLSWNHTPSAYFNSLSIVFGSLIGQHGSFVHRRSIQLIGGGRGTYWDQRKCLHQTKKGKKKKRHHLTVFIGRNKGRSWGARLRHASRFFWLFFSSLLSFLRFGGF